MALDVALPARSRARTHSLAQALTARVGLTAIVACSFLLRALAAAAHSTPRYFPDEYIYASLARSLAEDGRPLVRGGSAHFPALLEPILAAPFWALFSTETAYRLTQLENALFMSLAAVPVYLLARRLSLTAGYALACAAFAVALPDLVYAAYTLADPVAYPLALGAVYAGVVAVQSPSRRAQLAFVALAGLATFARVQYVVLPAAFLVAAIVVDRRRVLRAQRLALLVFGLPVVGALALGPAKFLGYYSSVADLHVGFGLVRWAGTDLFLLTLCAGVVLVPGALVGLVRARGRADVAFATFTGVFGCGLVLEAALYAANGSSRFQERYLFAVLPLLPVAFGLYLKRRRPWKLPVALVSVALLALSARVPVSGYAAALGKTDSPFLFAAFRLERSIGTANASVVVAGLVALAALGAIAVAWRGGARVAFGATLAVTALVSVGATMNDVSNARDIRRTLLPPNPTWVDARGLHDVTLVQTIGSPPAASLEQLFWNRAVRREVRLGNALPTDAFASPRLRIATDGTLLVGGRPLRTPLLFQGFAASASFDDAILAGHAGTFSLLEPAGTPRLRLLEQGRFWDGWLGRSGRLQAWPDASGRTRGIVSFTLSLPWTARPATVKFGRVAYRIEPGEQKQVSYTVDTRGPWSLRFDSVGGTFRPDLRAVSVLSTRPRFARADERRRASSDVS